MPRKRIESVKPGGLIRAGTINALIDRSERGQVRVGQGLAAANTRTGMLISLMKREREIWGRVAVVHGNNPDDPLNIAYDIDSIEQRFDRIFNVVPELNRPSRAGDFKIRPCRVGTLVKFIRDGDGEGEIVARLMVFDEVIAPSDCPPPEP